MKEWKELVQRSMDKKLIIERLMSGYFDNELSLLKMEVDARPIDRVSFIGFFDRLKSISDEHDKSSHESEKMFETNFVDTVFYDMCEHVAELIVKKAFNNVDEKIISDNVGWMFEFEFFTKSSYVIVPSDDEINEKRYDIASIGDWYDFMKEEEAK